MSERDSSQPATRAARLAALAADRFDVLVVGGGITGCGIARDAALRGLRVALIEKDDFASGTSSRSSRLIHGGVRYLEHGHLHLVFEASAERRRLLQLAPHLVRPLAFTWPVYAGARIPRWKLGAGLTLYDALALFRNVAPHRRLSSRQVLEIEPGLRRDGLLGGATYYDAATDDARLTLVNALGAQQAGAVVLNHAELLTVSFGAEGARARVRDRVGGADTEVAARVVVNATGPWSDDVRRRIEGGDGAAVRGSKGVHIAVPRDRVGNTGAVTMISPRDGRVMFVLPAGTQTIIGTTDTYTAASPDDVRATRRDVAYLLDSANGFYPNAQLTPDDVIAAWAGIRPLVSSRGKRPTSVSREHAVAVDARGVVTITGGKLTTYRVMATQVVDAALPMIGRRVAAATTDAPLPGACFRSIEDEEARAVAATGDGDIARHLVRQFGSSWEDAWRSGGDDRVRLSPGLPYTFGEIAWSAQHELVETLGDLLVRRTHLAFETRDHGLAVARAIAPRLAPMLGWDAPRVEAELAAYENEVTRIFGVDP